MILQKVNSSNLDLVGHDPITSEMIVRFKNGDIYRYENIKESVYKDMISAVSVGKFFNSNIRGKYEFKKIGREMDLLDGGI